MTDMNLNELTVLELRKVAKEMKVPLGAGISKQGIIDKLTMAIAEQGDAVQQELPRRPCPAPVPPGLCGASAFRRSSLLRSSRRCAAHPRACRVTAASESPPCRLPLPFWPGSPGAPSRTCIRRPHRTLL